MSKVKTAMIDALKQIGCMNEDGSLHLTKENLDQFLTRGRRGTKKTKGPKRQVAPSAYRLFMAENLEKIRGEHPEACEGRGNLLKKVGEIWKTMKENNDPAVEKYEKESTDAKEKMADEKSGASEEAKAEEPEEAKAEEPEEAKAEEPKPKKKFGAFSERSPPKVEPVSELIAKEMKEKKEKKEKKPKKVKKEKKEKKEKKAKKESGSESESNE